MKKEIFEQVYNNVPRAQREQLARFRSTHPEKILRCNGSHWKYMLGGEGERTFLLIPGSWHVADIWFMNIIEFEEEFRIISPTYPRETTMDRLVEGIAEILKTEHVLTADVLGHSFGGMIAQCLVRKYPEKVSTLILSNTDFPHAPKERKQIIEESKIQSESEFLSQLKKQYSQLIEPIEPEEKTFWKAFFDELFTFRITKDEFMGFLTCAYDYHKNYSFTSGDLSEWPGKILLLESTDDQYFSESQREALKSLYPQAQVHTFFEGGHTPSISRRYEFNSIVKEFLS